MIISLELHVTVESDARLTELSAYQIWYVIFVRENNGIMRYGSCDMVMPLI